MKEKLEFHYPKTMDDDVRKDRIFYQQMKQKNEGSKGSLNRKGRSLIPNKHSRFVGGRNVQQKPLSRFLARNQPKVVDSENRSLEGVTKYVNDKQSKSSL